MGGKCVKCGYENDDKVIFCSMCGERLIEKQQKKTQWRMIFFASYVFILCGILAFIIYQDIVFIIVGIVLAMLCIILPHYSKRYEEFREFMNMSKAYMRTKISQTMTNTERFQILEDRLLRGEISEETYKELKKKYEEKTP